MARDLEVEARLTLKDDLSKKAGTALDAVSKKARNAGKAADALAATKKDAGAQAYERTAQAADKAATAIDKVARSADRARDASGRFVSGSGSGLGRVAQDAARAERSMGRLEAMARRTGTALSKMGGAMGTARDVGAGLMAGGYVAARAVQKPIAYEKQLAGMANVAYSDRGAKGRIAGMKELDAVIAASVREGGGSREQAAGALNSMLAAGTDIETAKSLLPVVQKAATAAQADPNELALVLVKGIQQGQFKPEQAKAALEKAIRAGEAGQFELKDMARWLPQIMAAGKGMKGMEGYEQHLANLQAVAQVTGSSDQAGNAYFNLLGKLTAPDAAKNFEDFGVNLPKELSAAAQRGEDPVSAFARLVEQRVVNTNRSYKKIKAQLATAKGADRQALLQQAAEILQGSAVGRIIQDREAMLGLVGVMNQGATKKDVLTQVKNADGAIDVSYKVMASTTAAQLQQAANEKDIAASAAFSEVKPHIDNMLTGLRDAAQEFPRLTTVVYEAATALGVFAAVGMAWGGSRMLRGEGGKVLGGAGKLFGGAGKTAVEAGGKATLAKTAADVGGKAVLKGTALEAGGKAVADATAKTVAKETVQAGARTLGKGFLGAEFAMSAYDIWQTENDPNLTRQQKDQANTATYGGFGGALAGAAAGASAGSVVPVIGTTAGALIGGLLGWWAGREAGEGAGKLIYSDPVSKAQTEERQPIELNAKLALEVDGLTLAEVMEKYQTEYNFRSN
ncbi:phage tail tape measure protein [Bilophila wadsworthia]|uniref:phage tail tape measure protein n=1 Tax=Bilophila wadsworthia TaxID=35833 RepID=UPI001D0B9263|nr:phage tail tape measure protein [Bilophila wadsworthia]MCB8572872.1 phage tail tape measure protein [Bilophila wadsworthia]